MFNFCQGGICYCSFLWGVVKMTCFQMFLRFCKGMFISGNSAIWSNDDMMFLYRSFMLVMFVLLWWLLKIKLKALDLEDDFPFVIFSLHVCFRLSIFVAMLYLQYLLLLIVCSLPSLKLSNIGLWKSMNSFWDGLIFRGYVNFSGVYSFSLGRHFLHLRTSTTTPWSFFLRWIFLGA